jgi:PilZ domain
MKPKQHEFEERRGLRFPFSADAEVTLENSTEKISAQVTELSFRGCFLESSAVLKERHRLHVKIFQGSEFFEGMAEVIYVRPSGVGLMFGNLQPHFLRVLQGWILTALDNQSKAQRRQRAGSNA